MPKCTRAAIHLTDSVGDGISDAWRKQHFGGTGTMTNATSCAGCDADGDGSINSAEYVADTNPTNATSFFQVQSVVRSNGITLTFPSSARRQYTLYSTSQLGTGIWTNLPSQSGIPGTGGILSLTDSAPAGERQFYRVGVDLP